MANHPTAPFGYCPTCGAPSVSRERRPNGNDRCKKGHAYPSVKAVPPTPQGSADRAEELRGLSDYQLGRFRESLEAQASRVDWTFASLERADVELVEAEWDRRCAEREAEKAEQREQLRLANIEAFDNGNHAEEMEAERDAERARTEAAEAELERLRAIEEAALGLAGTSWVSEREAMKVPNGPLKKALDRLRAALKPQPQDASEDQEADRG